MDRLILHRLWIAVGAIACTMLSLQAQNISSAQETALRFLQSNPSQFNLSAEDVADVRVTDAYPSKHNGVTHIWVQQQYAGIPVYNALFGLHVKPDGSVFHLGHRFEPGLAKRANTTLPSLGAAKALELAMQALGFTGFPVPAVQRKINDRNWVFESGAVSRSEILVQICYDLNDKNQPRLAWKIGIDQANTPDVWTLLIDAQSGQVLHQYNHTVYCKAGHPHALGGDCPDETEAAQTSNSKLQTSNFSGSADESYRIFPLPVESPAHGARQLVVNPADPTASPFGWLDTDGAPGHEYTYTRGNNV